MSEEALAKIPGTTFSLKFGVEGKYYAVHLCRGSQPFLSKQLSILKGTTLSELPEELENGLRYMLTKEEIYLSPVIINRVVNDLLEQIPKDGQVFMKETEERHYLTPTVSVQEIIAQKEEHAGKKSMIEYTPGVKPKYDATAENIGKIQLREPRPLPRRDIATDITPTTSLPAINKDDYIALEEKVKSLQNEIQSMQEKIQIDTKEIASLKKQITSLKKENKELKTKQTFKPVPEPTVESIMESTTDESYVEPGEEPTTEKPIEE
ncbi:MAG: hypothetical protein JXA54_05480 [Candidatus Heimdallarchaeota archaeon]|nr:hypothetical protein [Candidatus Heimdallarchaeota archaeon]